MRHVNGMRVLEALHGASQEVILRVEGLFTGRHIAGHNADCK